MTKKWKLIFIIGIGGIISLQFPLLNVEAQEDENTSNSLWVEDFYLDLNNMPAFELDDEESSESSVSDEESSQTLPEPRVDETQVSDEINSDIDPLIDTDAVLSVFHQLMNADRIDLGLDSLTYGSHLQRASQNRNLEITANFSHDRPNGLPFHTAAGFEEAGSLVTENLQQTYVHLDASAVEIAENLYHNWKDSPNHFANMMNPDYSTYALQIDSTMNGDYFIIYATQILSN